MKSLNSFVNESLMDILLNESFSSEYLQKVLTTSDKSLKNQLVSVFRVNWSELKDSDYEIIEPSDAKRALKSGEGFGIFLNGADKIIGAGSGGWIPVSEYLLYTRKRDARAFKSLTAVCKEASKVIYFDQANYKRLTSNRTEISTARWATREDALAFKTNYQIASDQRTRYRTIVAANKISKDDTLEKIGKLMTAYDKTFQDVLCGAPDWSSMYNIQQKITALLAKTESYMSIKRSANDGRVAEYEQKNLDKIIIDVNKLLDQVEAEVKEQEA